MTTAPSANPNAPEPQPVGVTIGSETINPGNPGPMNPSPIDPTQIIYQGQFGEFTVNHQDRQEVVIYRSGLMVAALSFAVGTAAAIALPTLSFTSALITGCYILFTLALGVSLFTIHIYLKPLHRALQVFWAIGTVAALAIAQLDPAPFVHTIAAQPLTILGIGFSFAALTGIFFKEGFCFHRLETKLLTPLVPVLLLGHLVGLLPSQVERGMAIAWAGLFLVFALRKAIQNIPDDIGDKSVFEYLKQQQKMA